MRSLARYSVYLYIYLGNRYLNVVCQEYTSPSPDHAHFGRTGKYHFGKLANPMEDL